MMKTTIKQVPSAILFILMFGLSLGYGQSTVSYSAKDIEGIWRHPSGYELKIKDSQARIFAVHESGVPKKLVNGLFYDEIKYEGGNVWSAVFYQWRYLDPNKQNGRWVKIGNVTRVMQPNKKLITEDTRSFERVLE